MDNDIKRLLKLEQIKGFNLLDSEKKKLAEWKSQQKHIKPVAPKKEKVPKDHEVMNMGSGETPTIVAKSELGQATEEVKVVKNIVTTEDKETGKIEE